MKSMHKINTIVIIQRCLAGCRTYNANTMCLSTGYTTILVTTNLGKEGGARVNQYNVGILRVDKN